RASELTRQILACTHRDAPPLRPVGIEAIVEEALRILSRSVGRSVKIRADLRAPSERILGDPASLVQAVVNLGVNAGEAMPEGGILTVSASPYVSDGSVRFDDVPVPGGRYASVSVSDTGCGIPEAIRGQVFALFFTTKSPGEGAGLGLPLARTCIRAHRGFLRLESQAGKGTTVEFLIPVLEGPEPSAAPDLP
ncbi:MAG: sensor histidine kinase, partial [Verrucomicrobiota bacterium]